MDTDGPISPYESNTIFALNLANRFKIKNNIVKFKLPKLAYKLGVHKCVSVQRERERVREHVCGKLQ